MISGQNLTSPRTEILFTPLKGLQPNGALSAPIKALFDLASGLNAFNSDLAACTESRSEAAATVAAADPSDPNVPQEKGQGPTEPGVPSDMLDPMIIVGEWKLLLGKVDQCWWQGPHYPVRAATFSAIESIVAPSGF